MKKIQVSRLQGFTLIELMVGMVLSLILIAATITVYFSSQRTNTVNEGLVSTQNDAQLALSFLKEDIAKAGWANNTSVAYTLPSPLTSDFANNDGGTGSDTLKIRYESCDNSDAINGCINVQVDSVDCIGQAVAGGNIITNTYTVDANNQLTCNGQPLISNVESFQVLYGQISNTGLNYVTANNISDHSRIQSIRFGILVRSENDTAEKAQSRTINLLDKTINVNDKKLRLKYETTVVLLNKPIPFDSGI